MIFDDYENFPEVTLFVEEDDPHLVEGRVRILHMSAVQAFQIFAACARGDLLEVSGWPDDARLLGCEFDRDNDCLHVFVGSDDFEPVGDDDDLSLEVVMIGMSRQ